jgi:hypothetical protein
MSTATTPVSVDADDAAGNDGIAAFLRSHRDAILAGLSACVRVPSIAAQTERLYGCGASDAKGQIIAHLWGLRPHRADRGSDRHLGAELAELPPPRATGGD